MFDWIRKQFRRTKIKTLPLSYQMDRAADDQHIVQVFKHQGGVEIPVEDITALWQYGYQEKEETPEGDVLYVLGEKDRQTLLALRSLNPRIDGHGRLSFPFAPPILNYLRTKENVEESAASEKLRVVDKPLPAAVEVDYVPQEGLTIRTGFQEPDTHAFRPTTSLKKTADGQYAMLGDTFMPLPPPPSERLQDWWHQPVIKVPPGEIPEFFQRDLVLLKKEFTAVLTDRAGRIQIINDPFKPVVKVDRGKPGWLDFEVSYRAGQYTLPHGLLAGKQGETYLPLDEFTWIKNDPKTVAKTTRRYVVISTYETTTNDIDVLMKVPFFYIILDEATRIKNPQAKRTQAVRALNGAHRLALSGTPVENRPAEMWSVFDYLMRGHLGRFGTFKREFEDRIAAGDQRAAERLGKRVRPFMLRRLKGEVEDLPEKIPLDEWCELTEDQRQLYGAFQDEAKGVREAIRRGEQVNYTASILPILLRLKQICDHPAIVDFQHEPLFTRSEKFDWIVDKMREIKGQGEQVVVFSHFLGMIDLLEQALQQDRTSYIRIDGSTTGRQSLIDDFNERRAVVALCSLGATSQGINLTSANHVIHADRWWNPAIEDQATDRVHRIGQDKTVYVYRIMVRGTLEERIEDLLESKRRIAAQIVDAAGAGARQWTREELLELLRPLD